MSWEVQKAKHRGPKAAKGLLAALRQSAQAGAQTRAQRDRVRAAAQAARQAQKNRWRPCYPVGQAMGQGRQRAGMLQNPKRQREISLLLGLLLAVTLTVRCSSFSAAAERVRQSTLRLHVLAQSSSPADQLLKLRVRDAVLTQAGQLLEGCADEAAARRAAQQALPRFQRAAEAVVAASGQHCQVRIRLARMDFPAVNYERFRLPPGPYDALRVELGQARGHNWFCVLYPGLCLPAAQKTPVDQAWPTRQEQAVVGGGYQIEFAVSELWHGLCRAVKGRQQTEHL